VRDENGDEADGQDEVLFPGDYTQAGCIKDDEIYAEFVARISPGVHVVAVIDSCHSGTAMDLPYVCQVGEEELHPNERFNPASPCTALVPAGDSTTATKQKKGKGKKGDKKSKKKKDIDNTAKKSKKGKDGTKKTKKNVEPEDDVAASTVDEEGEDVEDEMLEEVEKNEPKKKRGFLGVFGRGRK
jgi:Caspase domain